MGDIDCNFGDCDCDCDPDCCCCCCPDFDQCFDGCCSWDGDHSLCCCIICIGGDDGKRNHRDSSCIPWLCCWNYDSRRRATAFSDDHWRSGPKQNGMIKEEKGKKKEPGSKQPTELVTRVKDPLMPHKDTGINMTPPIVPKPNISAQDVHPLHHHDLTLLSFNKFIN